MAKTVKTLRDLTPAEARRLIMEHLLFLHKERADVANFGALVADETDGYPFTVTLGDAVRCVAVDKAGKAWMSLPSGGAR